MITKDQFIRGAQQALLNAMKDFRHSTIGSGVSKADIVRGIELALTTDLVEYKLSKVGNNEIVIGQTVRRALEAAMVLSANKLEEEAKQEEQSKQEKENANEEK